MIAVTGAAGFIGNNFVRLLRRERPDDRVIALDALTYAGNLESLGDCLDGGYDAVITVGFLITDVTAAAAALHPDVYFIGVDQFHSSSLPNLVGIQFREDQAGFLAGV